MNIYRAIRNKIFEVVSGKKVTWVQTARKLSFSRWVELTKKSGLVEIAKGVQNDTVDHSE